MHVVFCLVGRSQGSHGRPVYRSLHSDRVDCRYSCQWRITPENRRTTERTIRRKIHKNTASSQCLREWISAEPEGGVSPEHTTQMVSFEMVNASEAALADGAAEMLVGGLHGEGLSVGYIGEELGGFWGKLDEGDLDKLNQI